MVNTRLITPSRTKKANTAATIWVLLDADDTARDQVEIDSTATDADVAEAIDFCEYYGREMLRLDAGGVVQSPPGEANTLNKNLEYAGRVADYLELAALTGVVTIGCRRAAPSIRWRFHASCRTSRSSRLCPIGPPVMGR